VTYETMTYEQLAEALRQTLESTEKAVYQGCLILRQMKRMKRWHPVMNADLFRRFVEVAEGRLSVKAAIKFSRDGGFLSVLERLPLAEQDRLVDGEEIPVVGINSHGQIARMDSPLAQLSAADLPRVFSDDDPATGGPGGPAAQVDGDRRAPRRGQSGEGRPPPG
jgi:hypothetical protein